MDSIIKGSFPKVTIVTDRFHVQQLVSEAVQEIRILLRKKAIKEESRAILRARRNKKKKAYQPQLLEQQSLGEKKKETRKGQKTASLR